MFERGLIYLRFHGKVAEMSFHTHLLHLNKSDKGGKEMVTLGSDGARRRLSEPKITLERLVILFDLPPSLVERRDLFGN